MKKHLTIPRSKVRKDFTNGHSIQIGNFFMIFGEDNSDIENDNTMLANQCTALDYNDTELYPKAVTSEIFSIKRQVWIKGPLLPFTGGCVYHACGASINRTHGFILSIFDSKARLMNVNGPTRNETCLDGILFSMETFRWITFKKCLINLKNLLHITQFSCTSYYVEKSNQM